MYCIVSFCVSHTQGGGDQTQVWSKDIPYICKSDGGTRVLFIKTFPFLARGAREALSSAWDTATGLPV